MINPAKRKTMTAGALLALAALFVAAAIISQTLLKGLRLDLTEGRLYSVSPGTRNILANLQEPINLYFFFSEQATQEVPGLRVYADRVKELLQEYVALSKGKIKLQMIDPQPFSEEEDRAAQFGLQGAPTDAGATIYFGLAGTNALDTVETIALFQPTKESFLEYDLSRLVYSLAHPKKAVVGLLAGVPLNGGFDAAAGQIQRPWMVMEQLKPLFQIRNLATTVTQIDPDIDVLMVVHPHDLSEQTQYAIDQFVLKGGRLLLFVDPDAESIAAPQSGAGPAVSSNSPRLLAAWGVDFDSNQALADNGFALSVSLRPGQPPQPHPGLLGVTRDGIAQDDVITRDLQLLTLATPGYLKPRDGAAVTPLLRSSANAMPLPAELFRQEQEPSQLQRAFKATGQRYMLAARLQGKAQSAFPAGPPAKTDADVQPADQTPAPPPPPVEHRKESDGPINVIVVADVDFLTDRLWVQTQNFFGQRIAAAWANNADFVANALDNLTGNRDLIGMRGRAVSTRPFTTVDALEREASSRFQATRRQLRDELEETEGKLNDLQRSRNDKNALILSSEQRAELERFQQRKLEIRKELRQVQRNLNENIERLGAVLKFINIILLPLVLPALVLLLVWLRARRREGVPL